MKNNSITAINKKITKIDIFEKDYKEWNKVNIYLEDWNYIEISARAEYESDSWIEVRILKSK
jgi:hypothetical protein